MFNLASIKCASVPDASSSPNVHWHQVMPVPGVGLLASTQSQVWHWSISPGPGMWPLVRGGEESSWRRGQSGDNCFNPTLAHPTLIPGLMLIHTMQRKLASSYNSWLWAKSDSNCPALPLYQVLIWALREVFISSGQFWRHTNKHWVMQTTDSEVRIVTSCDVVTCAGCRCHMMSHDVTASANQRRVLTWQEPIKRKSQLYSNILFTEDFPHK